jgi:hypothetical protein
MVSRGVVLEDRTTSGKPSDWGKAVVRAYHDWGANEVIAEANQGGEMVRHVIQSVPAQGGYPPAPTSPWFWSMPPSARPPVPNPSRPLTRLAVSST